MLHMRENKRSWGWDLKDKINKWMLLNIWKKRLKWLREI